MANNIVLNSGSGGATLAADDISSVWYQRVKLTDGTEDSSTAIAAGGGVEANALRVTIASDSTGVVTVDDGGGSLTVDGTVAVSSVSGSVAVTNAGTFVVQENGDALTALQLIDNIVLTEDTAHNSGDAGVMTLAVRNDTLASLVSTDGDYAPLQVSADGALYAEIAAALPAGTNAIGKLAANSGVDIGDVDVTSISAGSNLVGDVGISGARTSGGTTLYKNIDVDESEDEVKGSAGQLYWLTAINLASSVLYLKIYNDTAANVVVGTTVPDLTFPIPTQGDSNGAGFVLSIPNGIAFDTAITIAATTGVADNDSGAPGANEVIVNLGYA